MNWHQEEKLTHLKAKTKREMAAPVNSRLNVVVQSLTPFRSDRNSCWPSRESQLPRALLHTNHFFTVLPPERLEKSSLFEIGLLSFLFSCLFLARLCLLILIVILVPFSLISVRRKCDLAWQVSAILHLIQMGPFKTLTTLLF